MSRRGLRVLNVLSLVVVGLAALILLWYLVLLVNPSGFYNPFAPQQPTETVLVVVVSPTPTDTPVPPPTWTPTSTPTMGPTSSPPPSRTPIRAHGKSESSMLRLAVLVTEVLNVFAHSSICEKVKSPSLASGPRRSRGINKPAANASASASMMRSLTNSPFDGCDWPV